MSLFSLRVEEGKDKNDAAAAAGMSCGELAALCAAGCFSFEVPAASASLAVSVT